MYLAVQRQTVYHYKGKTKPWEWDFVIVLSGLAESDGVEGREIIREKLIIILAL